jgi:ABC-type amino acid transport substrate-binding protein
MSFVKFILTVLLAALVGAGVAYMAHPGGHEAAKPETAYERVMRTGVLRCAYGLWEPSVMRDPNTGQLSGFIYDFMQEVGKALNLKVEYNLEVPWDTIAVALKSGKADAHCAGVWATPLRGRGLAFSEPLFFSPTVAFARIDDNRFDYHLELANTPDVT